MLKNKIEVDFSDFLAMMHESFRYCLGSRSMAVAGCARRIEKYWPMLTEAQKTKIKIEIKAAIELDMAGDDCDISLWRKILLLSLGETHATS